MPAPRKEHAVKFDSDSREENDKPSVPKRSEGL